MNLIDMTGNMAYLDWHECNVLNVEVLEHRGQDFSQTLVKVRIADTSPHKRGGHNEYLWMDPYCIWIALERST